LRTNRRGFAGWAFAVTAVAAMYASFWPVFGHNTDLTNAVASFPQSMKEAFNMTDYSTATGYFSSTVFGLLVPILAAVFGIAAGTRAIATDEDAKTLELVAAHPVTRGRLATQRYLATITAMAGMGVLMLLVTLALRVPAKFTELAVGKLAATVFMLTLFAICFASIAFGIGAATGKKGITLGASAYLAVVAYLCGSFLPQIKGLHWVRNISPFAWYLDAKPLSEGIGWGYSGLLLSLGAVFAAAGIAAFRRRDLT
jgi:ABC-2 type transport system permease protein